MLRCLSLSGGIEPPYYVLQNRAEYHYGKNHVKDIRAFLTKKTRSLKKIQSFDLFTKIFDNSYKISREKKLLKS